VRLLSIHICVRFEIVEFCASANEAVQARELNRVALKRHAQLLDLLEIPQLLHTCISGGFIDEALELEAFAQKLVQMHGDIPVVAQLADEVRLASALLVRQLHEQLRGAIALPACLRVVGYLKRLGNYTEHELRVSFLRSRDAWLTGVLAALPHDTAYGYLSRLADTARLHMFEIVTQYRAIFSTGAGGGAAAGAVAAADGGDSSERGTTALLHSWLVQRTTFFLNALRRDLPQITDGASLASLLDQCMYFGLSLGRVGADFRPLLVPLFAARIFDVFERAVERATQRFVKRVKREQIPAPVTAVGHPAASTAPPSASAAAAASSASAAATQMPAPHASLVAHTWLALLANGWLTALNELRQCAAWLIAQRCADVLARSCTAAAQALRSVADQRLLEGAEATHFATLCGVFCEHLLPFVADCFGAVYRDAATNRRRRDWINMTEPKKLLAGLFEATSEATTAAGAPPSAATSSLSASSDSVKR
jgi:hypothetical protein